MLRSNRVFPMTDSDKNSSKPFLPDFCSVRVLFVVILSAELLAILLSLNQILLSQSFIYDLALNSLSVQWIALSCIGLLCISKGILNQQSIRNAIIFSFLIILLVTFIISELAWQVLFSSPYGLSSISYTHKIFMIRALGIAAILGGVLLRYLYLQHEWRKNIENVAASRLQALQSRIRPHFLFNCMNTIASLTRSAPKQAEEAVEDLAELFRASLLEFGNLYPISEEWQVCRLYLRIESHRLQDRLHVEWEIDTIPDNTLILPLCIQPLIENSIYHGIEHLAEGGTISIVGKLEKERVKFDITNPIPKDSAPDHHEGNQQALENIRQRLMNLYDDASRLTTIEENNQYIVTLSFPYQTK